MVNIRKRLRPIFAAVLGVAAVLMALVNPTYLMIALVGVFAVVMVARCMNLYKILMMSKRRARDVARIRHEIHAKLHTGFKDYSTDTTENENRTQSGTAGYTR
ncbi:MAG: hypothetical protein NWF00_11510 [Candidatus Bathyarchaeota archaeon]|nr:hypothetical protein [Candidatus Bathyarchaeota archaeon]